MVNEHNVRQGQDPQQAQPVQQDGVQPRAQRREPRIMMGGDPEAERQQQQPEPPALSNGMPARRRMPRRGQPRPVRRLLVHPRERMADIFGIRRPPPDARAQRAVNREQRNQRQEQNQRQQQNQPQQQNRPQEENQPQQENRPQQQNQPQQENRPQQENQPQQANRQQQQLHGGIGPVQIRRQILRELNNGHHNGHYEGLVDNPQDQELERADHRRDMLHRVRRMEARGYIAYHRRRRLFERQRRRGMNVNGQAYVHLVHDERAFALEMRNLAILERPPRVRGNSGPEQDNPEPGAANAEQAQDAAEPQQPNAEEQVADDNEGNEEANNEEPHRRRRQCLFYNNRIFRQLLRDIVNSQVPDEKQKLRWKVAYKMALNRYKRHQKIEKLELERTRLKWRKLVQHYEKLAKAIECDTTEKTKRTCENDKKCDVEVGDRSSDEENGSAIPGAKKQDKQIDNEREEQAKAAEEQARVKDVDEEQIDDVKKPEESNNSGEEDNDAKDDENEKDALVEQGQNDGAEILEQINNAGRADRIDNAGEEAPIDLSVRQEQINNAEEQNVIDVAAGPQQAGGVEQLVVNQVQDNEHQGVIRALFNIAEILERVLRYLNVRDLLSVFRANQEWSSRVVREVNRREFFQMLFTRDFCPEHTTHRYHDPVTYDEFTEVQLIIPRLAIHFCRSDPRDISKFEHMGNAYRCRVCFPIRRQLLPRGCMVLMNVCSARLVNGNTYNPVNTFLLPPVFSGCCTQIISYEYATRFSGEDQELPEEVVDSFFRPGEKSCVILFENRLYDHRFHYRNVNFRHFRVQFFKKLRERYTAGDVFWGGRVTTFMHPDQNVLPFFQGIKFNYPSDRMTCWSTWVIVSPVFTEIAVEALRRFREHVVPQLRRFTFGLQLHNKWLPADTAMRIQQAMPEIRLIHLTIDEAFYSGSEELKENVFASNSIIDDDHQPLKHSDHSAAILVVTYE